MQNVQSIKQPAMRAATIVHAAHAQELTTTSSPSTVIYFEQESIPEVAGCCWSNVLSLMRRNRDVFPTPNSPKRTTRYVAPRASAGPPTLAMRPQSTPEPREEASFPLSLSVGSDPPPEMSKGVHKVRSRVRSCERVKVRCV